MIRLLRMYAQSHVSSKNLEICFAQTKNLQFTLKSNTKLLLDPYRSYIKDLNKSGSVKNEILRVDKFS